MPLVPPGSSEGYITGRRSSDGYDAFFEWTNITEPSITKQLEYTVTYQGMEVPTGYIDIHLNERALGLPHRVHGLAIERVTGTSVYSLQNYLGAMAVYLLRHSFYTGEALTHHPVVIDPDEAELMFSRGYTHWLTRNSQR